MKEIEIKKEMLNLIKEINRLNYQYYTLDDPIVSDKEYDKIYQKLINLEKSSGIVLENSPTTRVGGEILSKFEKHIHIAALYSMDKAQNYEEILDWNNRNIRLLKESGEEYPELEYIVELKFDGLTINLTYEDGYLKMASTRGNGFIGEEILAQVKTIYSIPLEINYKGLMEVQGEGLMPLKSLEEYNKKHEEKLKNARNAAAGALRNLDPRITRSRNLDAYFYNIGYIENQSFKNDEEMKKFLKDNGFKVNKFNYKCKNLDEVIDKIEKIQSIRDSLDILIDGVTIKVNNLKSRQILGFTNKFPRWAIAYKFEAKEVITKVLDVIWNVGRSSKVTPTALLEAVDIDGVTIQRATLNNYDDIERKEVRLGSKVLIRRSNDVIPEILRALPTEEETFKIEKPKNCPSCGTELFQDGVHIFCPNTLSCVPQLISRLTHFASRDAMNIEGLSEMTISKLLSDLDVREIPQIYELKKEDLIKLEGFKEKRSSNLINAINASKEVKLENFIYALGISNVGIRTSRDLANKYQSFENFRKAVYNDLIEIDDIGPKTAWEIVEYFKDSHIKKSLDKLLSLGINPIYEVKEKENSYFTDKKIVLTGSLSIPRKELEKILVSKGGKITSSVSKNTDIVIVGEDAGSKYEKAKELNVDIMYEEELKKILGGEYEA
ncbi:MAG: NAD-dependent DNA ligase LigA [Peptoniphilaceae bacterium]